MASVDEFLTTLSEEALDSFSCDQLIYDAAHFDLDV